MAAGVFEAVKLAFDIVSRYATYLWNRGHRGFRALWLRVLILPLCIMATLAGYGLWHYRFRGLPWAFASNEVGFLIAEVPGDKDHEQQNAYAQAIRELSEKTPSLKGVVRVRLIERPLPADPEDQQAEALRIGHWLHAAFVLRPYTIEGFQEPWRTVVDQPHFSRPEAPVAKFQTSELASLGDLSLPGDLVLLARCALAFSFYRRASYDQASRELSDVLAAPSLPELAPSRWGLAFTYGNALCLLGKTDEGIAQFRRALAAKPDFAEAHNNLGIALREKHDLEGAIAECREALRLKPDYANAHNNLGAALADNHNLDGAIPEFREAVRLERGLAEAHNNLGVALRHKHDVEGAIAECREALRLKPDYANAHNSLGTALADKHDLDGAIAEYRKALRLEADFPEAHNNLGNALGDKHDLNGAIAEYRLALRSMPDSPEAHNNLGTALRDKGDLNGAIAEFREALRLKPDSPEAHYNLGMALSAKHDLDGAIAEYREAVRLRPDLVLAQINLQLALRAKADETSASGKAHERARPQPK